MLHRFRFLGAFDSARQIWMITGDEFFHAKKVLRLSVGAEIEVFDGKGSWGEGTLMEMQRDCALVKVAQFQQVSHPQPRLIIATGALQTQTMADLLPSLVELGADEVHVFLHDGVAKTRLNEKTKERWQKIVIAAAKQSKRAWLPVLQGWPSLTRFLDFAQTYDQRITLDPHAPQELANFSITSHQSVCLLLGSEKGLSQSEQEQTLNARFEGFALGPHILRSLTAAIAGTAILSSKRAALH